jgi:hypothetical protein
MRSIKHSARGKVLRDLPIAIRQAYDKLPEQVQAKVCMLHADGEKFRSEQLSRSDQRMATIEARREIQTSIARFNLDRERGWAPTRAELEEHQKDVADENELLEEIKKLNEQPDPVLSTESVWELLQGHPTTIWKHKAAIYDGPATIEALTEQREAIDGKKAERRAILGKPLTDEEGVAKLSASVKRIAARHSPQIERVLQYRRGARGYEQQSPIWTRSSDGQVTASEVLSIMFELFGDAIVTKYQSRLRHQTRGGKALSIPARQKRLATIDAQLLEMERVEEAIYLACLRAGLSVSRRLNAKLIAVLEIEEDTEAKKRTVPNAGESRGSLVVLTADDAEPEANDDFG